MDYSRILWKVLKSPFVRLCEGAKQSIICIIFIMDCHEFNKLNSRNDELKSGLPRLDSQ